MKKSEERKWGKMHDCFIYVTNATAGQMEVNPRAVGKRRIDMKSVECENTENVWMYTEYEVSEF